ncbi:hypothetical protein QFZ42_003356 [Variovorax paradoxus]|nr:hypothetical protein [Variovorax paradoxus]
MSAGPFVVYGKTDDTKYSVRTAQGLAVCTCAYNPATGFSDDRQEMAQLIADALNAYAAAISKATGAAS